MPPTLVPPVTSEGITIKDLNDAITVYRHDAAKLFVEAHNGLPPKPAVPARPAVPAQPGVPARPAVPAIPQESPEDAKKRSQGQLAAALSQLSNAETMLSAQQGREGFAAVVELMKSTQKTASAICTQLTELVKPTSPALMLTSTELGARLPIIRALTDALQVLAQISPAAGWQKPPSSGSGG